MTVKISPKDVERFWAKVNKDGPVPEHMKHLGRCWEWTAGLCCGYGFFRWKERRAHRISWMLHYGDIPNGQWVLHKCDNPKCLRPEHLFLGTIVENNADRDAKGRAAKGDRHWTRLHPEKVLRGEQHPLHLHPEWRARGDKSGARLHPEKLTRGVDHHSACLTEADVIAIRRRYPVYELPFGELTRIANKHGVTRRAIIKVIKRLSWKHI